MDFVQQEVHPADLHVWAAQCHCQVDVDPTTMELRWTTCQRHTGSFGELRSLDLVDEVHQDSASRDGDTRLAGHWVARH